MQVCVCPSAPLPKQQFLGDILSADEGNLFIKSHLPFLWVPTKLLTPPRDRGVLEYGALILSPATVLDTPPGTLRCLGHVRS